MDYKRGFNIKPKEITGIGEVIFTDGTNDVVPNQLSCEAYGYTYNADTGTCVKHTDILTMQIQELV
jgi:hypothetical protein